MLALRLHPWPPAAAFLLGLIAAAAAALVVRNVVRGVNLPRWVAWSLALFLFVAILADAVGGLAPLTAALDQTGFTLGSRRFTLLALVQIVIGLLALYAAVRLAIRLTGQWIKRSHGLDPTQQLLTQKLAALAVIALAFFIGIDLAGIDLTALAVFSGALGLAVGFGLQKTFGNLIAGIILLMDRSIKPGDVISVGETFGLGQQDRRARGLDRHPRRQGISDPERAADDPGGRQLVLFDARRAHLDSGRHRL